MPKLKTKCKICIVAPAGALQPDQIKEDIAQLEASGFEVILGKHLYNKYFYGYNYAGTPKERIEDLQWAIDHKEAQAIWFARGGYGGVQLIDSLNWDSISRHPKWVIGYSDNTVFHQHLSSHNIPSIHGRTIKPLSADQSQDSLNTVLDILTHGQLSQEFQVHEHNAIGTAKGMISGGNLSILYSLMGSKTLDTFKGKILFIEDWQENWYHLDRMLTAMLRAGIFADIKGLLVGSFTKMDVKEENQDYASPVDPYSYQIISDLFKSFDIPKAFGLPMGHIDDNRALILGRETEVLVSKEKVLIKQ